MYILTTAHPAGTLEVGSYHVITIIFTTPGAMSKGNPSPGQVTVTEVMFSAASLIAIEISVHFKLGLLVGFLLGGHPKCAV